MFSIKQIDAKRHALIVFPSEFLTSGLRKFISSAIVSARASSCLRTASCKDKASMSEVGVTQQERDLCKAKEDIAVLTEQVGSHYLNKKNQENQSYL